MRVFKCMWFCNPQNGREHERFVRNSSKKFKKKILVRILNEIHLILFTLIVFPCDGNSGLKGIA